MSTEWQIISVGILPEVVDLASRCLAFDGGLKETVSEGFLKKRYSGEGVLAYGAFSENLLVGAGSVRPSGELSIITGFIDPRHRGRGLASSLLKLLVDEARRRSPGVELETESLSATGDALLRSRGFRQTFAEDVMRCDLSQRPPTVDLPLDLVLECWETENQGAFYEAYRGSFADRPGFPDWTQDQWVQWTVDDSFRPGQSLVARRPTGDPIGFVTVADGFLIQAGCVPQWRRRGVSRALATSALSRMAATGEREAFVDVNINNDASMSFAKELGFATIARRARYQNSGIDDPQSR
ncbi:GNAT family N-acetyltransferase [Streptomyces sp. NPDC058664]|uniref:GNAT family N-acetyltransferase n=1 Tax=unclassified Streptomyces TaxID=2593676 RepID=UPI003646BC24